MFYNVVLVNHVVWASMFQNGGKTCLLQQLLIPNCNSNPYSISV